MFLLHFLFSSPSLSSPLSVSHTTNPARQPPPLPAIPFSSVHCTVQTYYTVQQTADTSRLSGLGQSSPPSLLTPPRPPHSRCLYLILSALTECGEEWRAQCCTETREQSIRQDSQSVRRERIIFSSLSPTLSHRNTQGGSFCQTSANLHSWQPSQFLERREEKANMHLYIIRAGGWGWETVI